MYFQLIIVILIFIITNLYFTRIIFAIIIVVITKININTTIIILVIVLWNNKNVSVVFASPLLAFFSGTPMEVKLHSSFLSSLVSHPICLYVEITIKFLVEFWKRYLLYICGISFLSLISIFVM